MSVHLVFCFFYNVFPDGSYKSHSTTPKTKAVVLVKHYANSNVFLVSSEATSRNR